MWGWLLCFWKPKKPRFSRNLAGQSQATFSLAPKVSGLLRLQGPIHGVFPAVPFTKVPSQDRERGPEFRPRAPFPPPYKVTQEASGHSLLRAEEKQILSLIKKTRETVTQGRTGVKSASWEQSGPA